MTQLLTAHLLAGVEIFILVSMAFDCYIAIIKPLHCMVIMNRQKYNMLIVLPWAVSFWHSIALLLMVLKSPFCGTNQIDHYLCDVKPHLKLVYKDIHAVNILMIANSGMVVVLIFFPISFLYNYIILDHTPLLGKKNKKLSQPVVLT